MLATPIPYPRRHDADSHARQIPAAALAGRVGGVERVGPGGSVIHGGRVTSMTLPLPTRGLVPVASSVSTVGPVDLFGATVDLATSGGLRSRQQLQDPAPAAPMPA